MSKIVVPIFMPHHHRFVKPVIDELRKRGHECLYFTTASDFPFETGAYKEGYPCPLLQSYTNDDIKLKMQDSVDKFFDLWANRVFQLPAAQQWPLVSATNLITCAIKECFHFEEFLRVEKPDLIAVLQPRNRWGQIFAHYSRKAQIPYVCWQEGDIYEDRLAFHLHTQSVSHMYVWGQHTKDRLVGLGCAPEKLILAGNTHLQDILSSEVDRAAIKSELKIDPNKKTVLFIVGLQWAVRFTDPKWKNFLYWFKDNSEWQAIVKWHPKVTFNSYQIIAKEFPEKHPGVMCVQNYDIYKLLPLADYCVSLGKTTSAVEALCWGKPLVTCRGFDGQIDDLAEWNVSQRLEPFKKQSWKMLTSPVPQAIQKGSRQFLENYFYKGNREAVKISADNMEKLINEPYFDTFDQSVEDDFLKSCKL